MNRRKRWTAFVLFFGIVLLSGCTSTKADQIVVATTLFPQYDIVNQIAEDQVEHYYVLPAGAAAHNFEPSPSMIASILSADIVFYTSLVLEPWMEPLIEAGSDTLFVDLSTNILLLEDQDEEHQDHEEVDPHYWLNPNNLLTMLDTIYETLEPLVDTSLKENYVTYKQSIISLDESFDAFFSTMAEPVLLYGGHNSFGYFAERYGVTYITPYSGFGTDAAPTPQALFTLMDALDYYHSAILYTELYIEPLVAEAIAEETGAKIIQLAVGGTISKEAMEQGVTYLDLMYQNLEKLKEGVFDAKI